MYCHDPVGTTKFVLYIGEVKCIVYTLLHVCVCRAEVANLNAAKQTELTSAE